MSEQHCPDGTCHGCYGCECLDNPDCFVCNDRRETRRVERERIIALLKAVDDELGIFAVGWAMQEIAELIKGEN